MHDMVLAQWNYGANVIRFWGFMDGTGNTMSPIQNPVGVFHESALVQFDLALATFGSIGMRAIVALVNFWNDYGGMQW